MDNEKNPELPQDDSWLDAILDAPELAEEIGPDEHAVTSAGLSHMEDPQSSGGEAFGPDPLDAEIQELLQEPSQEDATDADLAAILDQASSTGDAPPVPPEAEEEAIPQEPDTPVRKGRPRREKGYGLLGIPHILATFVWLAIAVAIGISLGRMLWVCAADVLAFGREDKQVVVTITDTDDLDTIASKLKNAGLIRYPGLFKQYVNLTDSQEEISAGTFTLNTLYDYHALVNSLSYSSEGREVVEVTIPEGYNCAQIFALLEEKGVCTAAELEEYAASGELDDYWFLEGVQRGTKYCLEGYLFPDTYLFYTNDEPGRVLEKFLDDFDYRFTDIMHDKLETLNERLAEMMAANGYDEEYIADNLFTIREVVIVASMVEKESSGVDESYKISAVIYNRLTNLHDYPFLNIDATIVYALGGKDGPLTESDLQVDSPYNTYTNMGLIPGPISNPGQASLNAALDPDGWEDENGYTRIYYYYALNPDTGRHEFFTNQAEFERFLASLDND